MNYISSFFEAFAHLLYPDICAGCGSDLLSRNQLLCLDCDGTIPVTNFHRHQENPVEKIFRGRLPLVAATAYAYFSKQSVVQALLHQFKYKGRKDVGLYLGRRMGECFRTSSCFEDVDILVPLPLHASKKQKRGYNQAEVICEGLASVLDLPVAIDVVKRQSMTDSQTRKNRMQRWNNMEGKFILTNDKGIRNKHLLLVDDVITTGATLESCGRELMKVPGVRLSVAAFAFTSV